MCEPPHILMLAHKSLHKAPETFKELKKLFRVRTCIRSGGTLDLVPLGIQSSSAVVVVVIIIHLGDYNISLGSEKEKV